ncbi:MAG TPA: beta-propeller domain-containing protein, partial [Vicinamibacterales bacterium]|nr:beta-propeller domain-containing protein [Vicinamibacterales bacterium]
MKQREKDRQHCLEWSKSFPQKVDCNNVISESITVSATAVKVDEDTNRQHHGVDEGGLVNKAGEILVVLRRGRLFTIDMSGAQLAMVDMADLATQGGNHDDSYDWYDELLIANGTVIVIGYSNSRGGTEIVLFNLREGGRLEHRATYNLRSDDYYSGENYASRLVGGKLILYTTRTLPDEPANLDWLPAMRRWRPGATVAGFERIASWDRVFKQAAPLGAFPTVHTMVTCDPSAVEFTCEGSILLADYLSVYYASPTAGYAWTRNWSNYPEGKPAANLYRIPFDGAPISALQVHGDPQNQLAFLESDDGHLNVVVQENETEGASSTSLLRVPLNSFGDGSDSAPPDNYRVLARDFEWPSTRFIGEFVLVGDASRYGVNRLVATRWPNRSSEIVTLPLQHGVDRIEAMGNDAIVIGPHGTDLGMTTIKLAGAPVATTTLVVENARESESRTHGFLYRA